VVTLHNQSNQQSVVLSFYDRFCTQLTASPLDPSRLGLSLTKCLSQASATHQDSKIDQIEYELQEIAEDVKKNIGQIFERGERVEMLASKS